MSENEVTIRPMKTDEMPLWGALRTKLWPDCLDVENQIEFANFKSGQGALKIVFLAFAGADTIGFAEISERSVAAKCGSEPVAYLEGWYVDSQFRGQGIGGRMIEQAAGWSSQQGYAFFASDVELDNRVSQSAHLALGFEETGQVVTYRMRLNK